MRAIRTKYYGPTNTKGSRIVASDGEGNMYIMPYAHEHNTDKNHELAAGMLLVKMGWRGPLKRGWFKNECFHIFIEE